MFDQVNDPNSVNSGPAGPATSPDARSIGGQGDQFKPNLKEARRELDDIFNDVSPAVPQVAAKPAVFMPKISQPMADMPRDKGSLHKLAIPMIAVAGLALAVVGGYFGYRYIVGKLVDADIGKKPVGETVQTVDGVKEPVAEDDAAAPNPVQSTGNEGPAFAGSEPDADADGLTDAEEAALGTNSQNVDTDGDGLFDREEAKVFKTNPLDPDTDKDGFTDGNEVRDGYNPNGDGRLYEVKSE